MTDLRTLTMLQLRARRDVALVQCAKHAHDETGHAWWSQRLDEIDEEIKARHRGVHRLSGCIMIENGFWAWYCS